MPRSLPVILAICCLLFSLSTALGAGNVAQKATYRGNAQSLIFHASIMHNRTSDFLQRNILPDEHNDPVPDVPQFDDIPADYRDYSKSPSFEVKVSRCYKHDIVLL